MNIEYDPPRIEDDYQNFKKNSKKYGKQFAEDLEDLLIAIDAATNALDIYNVPCFKMHMLKGNYHGAYSLSPDNKSLSGVCSPYALMRTGKKSNPMGMKKNSYQKYKL